jgi:hypothetical protein
LLGVIGLVVGRPAKTEQAGGVELRVGPTWLGIAGPL